MSRPRQISSRIESYAQVSTMLSAMKNMALMDLRKLSGQLDQQHRIMETVGAAAAGFVARHNLAVETGPWVCVVIGSERGFCGDFNEDILPMAQKASAEGARLLLVGNRLAERFAAEAGHASLPGANITEEIPAVLEGVASWLQEAQAASAGSLLRVTVLFHEQQQLAEKTVAPLPLLGQKPQAQGAVPVFNLEPAVFLERFMVEAMLLALREIFMLSLAAENHRRLEHMDNALHRLADMSEDLSRQLNRARQEEIIQEIETVLLGREGGGWPASA